MKKTRLYRPIQVRTGIYDAVKDLAKRHKTSMAGVVSFFVNELMNGKIGLDWVRIRELYPDARGRNQKQWARVDEVMAVLHDSETRVGVLIRQAAKRGVSELQVRAWLKKRE